MLNIKRQMYNLFIFEFLDNVQDAREDESPTKTPQLVYAQLDLSQPTSTINHSPSSLLNATYNRSPFLTPNPDLAGFYPTLNPLSKSADPLLLGNSGALMSNGPAAQEEKIECSEYTHIDLSRTQAYLESKLQNENKEQFTFEGAASNFASNSIPEDRAISTNGIREGNNNPLTKFTKVIPTASIAFSGFSTKRNSVISN